MTKFHEYLMYCSIKKGTEVLFICFVLKTNIFRELTCVLRVH